MATHANQNWISIEGQPHILNDVPGVDWVLLNETVASALRRYGAHSKDRFLNKLFENAIWQWTERTGKYATGFVTRAALQQRVMKDSEMSDVDDELHGTAYGVDYCDGGPAAGL